VDVIELHIANFGPSRIGYI